MQNETTRNETTQNETTQSRILLFIPGYNCEKQIQRVLDQLEGEIAGYLSKIIVVNNRSTDNTEQAVIEWATRHAETDISLLRNDANYNLGGSHKVAFEYAIKGGFDYVIVLHGDDQGSVGDMLPLLRGGAYEAYDCCLGSRFMRGSALIGYSVLRTAANRVFNLWFSIVTFRRLSDLGSGLNLYKVEPLKKRYYMRYPDKLFFNGVMLLATAFYRQKVKFFPISWREADQVSNAKLFDIGVELLKMTANYLFRRNRYMESDMRRDPVKEYAYQVIFDSGDYFDAKREGT